MHEQLTIRDWLKALGTLCAGTMSARDAQAKLAAYVPLLAHEFPAAAFTAASLTAVGRTCKWFPSFGEVTAALSAWWEDNQPFVPTVALLTGPKPDIPKPRAPATEAELAAVSGITAALKANYGYHRSRQWSFSPESNPAPSQVLSPERLLATYERLAKEGDAAAALRVAMLRRQIAEHATEEANHEPRPTAR